MPETRLTYEDWLKKYNLRETPDYDYKGAFEAGLTPGPNGHLDDTFKLPNHITYSSDSHAARQEGAPPPGRWEGSDEKGWTFYASPTNIANAGGVNALKKYFKKYEKSSKLVLPTAKASGGVVIDDGNPAKRRKLI